MSVRSETEAMIESLGDLTPHGRVLAAVALELADSVDHPPEGAGGNVLSVGPFANSLRATLDDLDERGRVADDDVGDTSLDWASLASGAGATPIRDTA